MNKENYFRKIIIRLTPNSNIETILDNLPNWSYQRDNKYGDTSYDVLEHKTKNVKVLLKKITSDFFCSQNILPSDGKKTCVTTDFDDIQEHDIKKDILFELCKEINEHSDIYCGIIPAKCD